MRIEAGAFSSAKILPFRSPLEPQQEDDLAGIELFPKDIGEFEHRLKSLSERQKSYERSLFWDDIKEGMKDWALFPYIPLTLSAPLVKKDKSTLVIGPGFGTTPLYYRPTELWFQNEGHRTVVYRPKAFINIEPISSMDEHYMEFLSKERHRSDGPLDVLAHSKAGLLNRYVSIKYPDEYRKLVGRVIYLGSPIPSWVNSAIGEMYLRCLKWFAKDDFGLTNLLDSIDWDGQENVSSVGSFNDAIMRGDFTGFVHIVDAPHTSLNVNFVSLRESSKILDEPLRMAA